MPIMLVVWVLVLQKLKREMEALRSSSRGLLQSYREEYRDCLSEIVQAVQTAQLHCEALLGKTDPDRRCREQPAWGLGIQPPQCWGPDSSRAGPSPCSLAAYSAEAGRLEQSLRDVTERWQQELRERRRLQDALAVGDPPPDPDNGGSVGNLLLQELKGNIRVHCRIRPLLPFDDEAQEPVSPDRSPARVCICRGRVAQLCVSCFRLSCVFVAARGLVALRPAAGKGDERKEVLAELRRALLEAGSGRAASPAACRSSSYKPACRPAWFRSLCSAAQVSAQGLGFSHRPRDSVPLPPSAPLYLLHVRGVDGRWMMHCSFPVTDRLSSREAAPRVLRRPPETVLVECNRPGHALINKTYTFERAPRVFRPREHAGTMLPWGSATGRRTAPPGSDPGHCEGTDAAAFGSRPVWAPGWLLAVGRNGISLCPWRVYGPAESQRAVFEDVCPLLTSFLDGYNVCIMAYGQTGSGKSFTMLGPHCQEEPALPSEPRGDTGIVPRAAAELFRLISEDPSRSPEVGVSIVEIYNNDIFDLLAKDGCRAASGAKRQVLPTQQGKTVVCGLTYQSVRSAAQFLTLVGGGLKLRAKQPTAVHAESSRSHLVITVTLATAASRRGPSRRPSTPAPRSDRSASAEPCQPGPRSPATGRRQSPPVPLRTRGHGLGRAAPDRLGQVRATLQLVDLAGSECAGVSGVTGPALRETSCINRSLAALSDVLGALAEGRGHIPYRNSRLTHLLQDALGGDAKLQVIVCVSPGQRHMAETLQSLGFGARARQVERGHPAPRKLRTWLPGDWRGLRWGRKGAAQGNRRHHQPWACGGFWRGREAQTGLELSRLMVALVAQMAANGVEAAGVILPDPAGRCPGLSACTVAAQECPVGCEQRVWMRGGGLEEQAFLALQILGPQPCRGTSLRPLPAALRRALKASRLGPKRVEDADTCFGALSSLWGTCLLDTLPQCQAELPARCPSPVMHPTPPCPTPPPRAPTSSHGHEFPEAPWPFPVAEVYECSPVGRHLGEPLPPGKWAGIISMQAARPQQLVAGPRKEPGGFPICPDKCGGKHVRKPPATALGPAEPSGDGHRVLGRPPSALALVTLRQAGLDQAWVSLGALFAGAQPGVWAPLVPRTDGQPGGPVPPQRTLVLTTLRTGRAAPVCHLPGLQLTSWVTPA
nr:PREDICTED: kinesin-like protein KIF25 [Bos mutus]